MTATITVTTAELHARLDELLAAARAGTDVLVCDEDQPVVRLSPAPSAQPPAQRAFIFNMHPGAMVMREDFDDPIDEDAFLRGEV